MVWLAGNAQPTGGYGANGDTGTKFQVTAEALRTFLASESDAVSDVVGTLAHLGEETYAGTEYRSRRIVLLAQADRGVHHLLPDLLGDQNPDGGFGSDSGHQSTSLDTAYALEALHIIGESGSPAAAAASEYLRSRQTKDGAWTDAGGEPSVFVTAHALRALWYGRHYYPTTETLDGAQSWILARWGAGAGFEYFETALALLGVLPRLSDTTPVVDLLAMLRAGQNSDGSWGRDVYTTALALRALNLATRPVPDPDLATLQGRVVDGDTGLPLAGTQVVLDGAVSPVQLTDERGRFLFQGLPVGDYGVILSLSSYGWLTTATRLDYGEVLDLGKLTLLKDQDSPTVTVRGRIVDGESGQPLPGALVTTDQGQSAHSAMDGTYQIAALSPGEVRVGVSLDDYVSASSVADVAAGSTFVFSPALNPSGVPSPGNGPASLTGLVVDSSTDLPLAGVSIDARYGDHDAMLVTDSAGSFLIEDVGGTTATLRFALEGYRSSVFSVAVEPDLSQDIGQVRLRAEDVDNLLPDLVAVELDTSRMVTDPHSLSVTGTLDVLIENRGTAAVARGYEVVAFSDADGDGHFDQDSDRLLGRVEVPVGPMVGEASRETLVLESELPFRDAPASVWVDSAEVVVEAFEQNNRISSASLCKIEAPPEGQLDPVVKWHWARSAVAPTFDQVMSAPVVAQLNDDNGDGRIDQFDFPDVVFTTFEQGRYQGRGVLRAVSGVDGSDIWDPNLPVPESTALHGPAVGDIDKDGLIEIVVGGPSSKGLSAFENDGRLKWHVAVEGSAEPALADLDNDGDVEILYGRRVFAADGTLEWGYPLEDIITVAVDLDLDGTLEVISKGKAYDAQGNLLWDSGYGGVFATVGNFDADSHPEIVVQLSGSLVLLNHDGGVAWGPVAIPGSGGRGGGAPTVADVDGDGEPEIGTAAASRYSVFETDGSLKWSNPVQDFSSARTGSTVFDFEGDGRAEILYNDELKFRIYDGSTGTVLYETGNTSGTLWEYPVVVDVDADGHAEIVLVTNNYYLGGLTGVRVLESRDDTWAPTRQIWNQHSYHITNVNDDGTIPRHEEPSWLVHNTYRLNTFADRDPLAAADLSVSRLELIDNGTQEPMSLSVRVGNGGELVPVESVRVSFLQGDPEAGGILLGELDVAELPAPGFRDVLLEGVLLSGTGDIYALVDRDGRIDECTENNNRTRVAYDRAPALAQITTSTDATSYGPKSQVRFGATVTNTGSYSNDYGVELRVEDAAGNLVTAIALPPLTALAPGVADTLSHTWNTGVLLSGEYRLRGLLSDAAGTLLGEATTDFDILPRDGLLASVALSTDSPSYHTSDRVEISVISNNLTANKVLAQTRIELEIRAWNGGIVRRVELPLGDLTPGGLRHSLLTHDIAHASEGQYEIGARLFDAKGNLLAEERTVFEVAEDLSVALSGTVSVATPVVQRGDTQLCTETLRYGGAQALSAQPVRHLAVHLGEAANGTRDHGHETIALSPGSTLTWVRDVPTAGLALDDYACVLQAEIGGIWTTLDYATFAVSAPPIDIEATLGLGEGFRLLALLDDSTRCDINGSRDRDDDEEEGFRSGGEDGEGHGKDDDEHEEADRQVCTALERSFLEEMLDTAGWSYTLVEDADAFARELRRGSYGLYLLQGSHVKLEQQIQRELVEAVYNGAGLVVAGDHDERNGYLDDAVGVQQKGKLAHVEGVALTASETFPSGQADVGRHAHARRIKLDGAAAIGFYIGGHGSLTDEPAISRYTFGNGRSLYFGFDLLAEATQIQDPDGLYPLLLLAALADVEPNSRGVEPAAVLPVKLALRNRGIATSGRVLLTLPEDVLVADSGTAVEDSPHSLRWPFSLDEAASVELTPWLRMPDAESSLTLDALVQIGQSPDYQDHLSLQLVLDAVHPPGLETALLAMEGDSVFDKPLKYLRKGARMIAEGDFEKALENLVKSARAVGEVDAPEAVQIRHWVDNAIARVARLTVSAPRPWQLDRALSIMTGDEIFEEPLRYLQRASDAYDRRDLDKAVHYLATSAEWLGEIEHPKVLELRQWLFDSAAVMVAEGDAY